MIFTKPMPFTAALDLLRGRKLLPNDLSSAQLRELGGEVLRNATTSAQVARADILNMIANVITDVVDSEKPGIGGSLDPASARKAIGDFLAGIGYTPDAEKAGSLQDLSSYMRTKVIVDTNVAVARGYGQATEANTEGALDAFPAQELFRFSNAAQPRGWAERWKAAGGRFYGGGRMIARVDDDVWQNLGDGAGGYDDTLGNPFAPFAFNSGMRTRLISRREAEQLGVIGKGEQVQPRELSLGLDFTNAIEQLAPALRAGIQI